MQFATGSSPPQKKKRCVKKHCQIVFPCRISPAHFFWKKMHSLYWHTPLSRISQHAHIFWALSCTFVQGNQRIKFRFASKVLNGENARSVLLLCEFFSPPLGLVESLKRLREIMLTDSPQFRNLFVPPGRLWWRRPRPRSTPGRAGARGRA